VFLVFLIFLKNPNKEPNLTCYFYGCHFLGIFQFSGTLFFVNILKLEKVIKVAKHWDRDLIDLIIW
jgi:hypothetical protein